MASKGLRQGDPVSPLLFVIAMEALTAIVVKATQEGVLSSYTGISAMQRLSIYADDVAFFVRPSRLELEFVRRALDIFGEALGLKVNYRKSSAILIRGSELDKTRVAAMLQCDISEFPCKYLGLPLHFKKITRANIQPTLDKMAARLQI